MSDTVESVDMNEGIGSNSVVGDFKEVSEVKNIMVPKIRRQQPQNAVIREFVYFSKAMQDEVNSLVEEHQLYSFVKQDNKWVKLPNYRISKGKLLGELLVLGVNTMIKQIERGNKKEIATPIS
jgi:N-acetylneuraminic acid mutarotase